MTSCQSPFANSPSTVVGVTGSKYLLTDDLYDVLWDGLRECGLVNSDGTAMAAELARRVGEIVGSSKAPTRAAMSHILKERPSERPDETPIRSEFLVAMLKAVGKPGWMALELTDLQRELLLLSSDLELLPTKEQRKILDDIAERVGDKLAARGKK